MKNILKIYIAIVLAVFTFSCEEEIVQKAVLNPNATANSLESLKNATYTLLEESQSEVFETFTWTATDFGFAASVNYTLLVDGKGNAFANAQVLASTYDLKTVVNVGALNKALLALGLAGGESSEIEFKVVSKIETTKVQGVSSSLISVTVTPFAPSVLKPMYIIGDDQSWGLDKALQLNVLEIGEYEVVGNFGNGSYWRFFEEPAWDAVQYGYNYFETIDSDLTDGGGGDSNFIFSAATGVYKITVSLNNKTIVVEPATAPKLFIVGDPGWNFNVEATWLGGGKYQGSFDFTNGGIFRFFTEKDNWSSQQYNYTYFMDGTLSSNLSGTTEGDANLTFTGATGTHSFTVDLYSHVFKVVD